MAPTTRSTTRKAAMANAAHASPLTSPTTADATSPRSNHNASSISTSTEQQDEVQRTSSMEGMAPGWAVSTTGGPRQTVEDDFTRPMSLADWQRAVMDEEDFAYLQQALQDVPPDNIDNTDAWAAERDLSPLKKSSVSATDEQSASASEEVNKTDGTNATTNEEGTLSEAEQ